jgi:transcriptional regulator with XRE-family HTH domain
VHRIRQLRKKRKLTQEKLAELTGLHPTYIGRIERGERNISLRNIEDVLTSFQISIDDLCDISIFLKIYECNIDTNKKITIFVMISVICTLKCMSNVTSEVYYWIMKDLSITYGFKDDSKGDTVTVSF